MASDDQVFKMLQDNSNHILELIKRTENLAGQVMVFDKTIDRLKNEQENLSIKNNKLISMISERMTPDRCAHMHNEFGNRIKKEMFFEIKQGARGWARTALVILKFAAYASLVFGGSAVGAQALGLIKI